MAIKARKASTTVRYVPDSDPDKGNPEKETAFILSPLDLFATTHIFDIGVNLAGLEAGKVSVYRMNLETCRLGIQGWQNLESEDGVSVPFETSTLFVCGKPHEGVSDASLGHISFALIRELAGQIHHISGVESADTLESHEP